MYLQDGFVMGHEIGVNIQTENYDTGTLQNSVIFNNRRTLAADDLPIPDPAEEIASAFHYVMCFAIANRGCCAENGTFAYVCDDTGGFAVKRVCDNQTIGPCGWPPVGYVCGGDGEDPSGTYPMVCPGMEAD